MALTPQDFVSKWKRVNEAVFGTYAWKTDLSNDEVREKLLALNLERAKVEQGPV